MPTYNQWDHIKDALASLANQTMTDFELIVVVDGGSIPEASSVYAGETLMHLGHRWTWVIYSANRGTAHALNTGFKLCTGKYWTWISSDNVMHFDWLETLYDFLEKHPDTDGVYSSYMREDGCIYMGEWAPVVKRAFFQSPYKPGCIIESENCPVGPSFLCRTETVRRVGDHRGRISHDLDFWLRFEEEGKLASLPVPLCTYRVHDQRVTVTRRQEYDAPHWLAEARKRRGL
jgi:glycosyltransferase involved in cell wall biosynthesis